jgi:hypothetical protein
MELSPEQLSSAAALVQLVSVRIQDMLPRLQQEGLEEVAEVGKLQKKKKEKKKKKK